MKGLGFFIWQLNTINDFYSPTQLADLLKQAKVSWVAWKLCEGIYRYNQIGGNDDQLKEYMAALADVGIVSGGWSYNYPTMPGTQAKMIETRMGEFPDLDHWMLDIEAEWKQAGLNGSIDSLLNFKSNIPVGFCSYRFPNLHPPLNYGRFLSSPTVDFSAPQVYWLGSHNPAAQLDTSYAQYAKYMHKPFVPIGVSWGQVVGGAYWEASAADLEEFVQHCASEGWDTYGFWSLDWIAKHKRLDMLEAISGAVVTPPIVEPPVVEPPVNPPSEKPIYVRVRSGTINVRNAPNLTSASDVGNLTGGSVLRVCGDSGAFHKVELYVAKSVVDVVSSTPVTPPVIQPPAGVPEYRVAHDRECGQLWRSGVPEVFHVREQEVPIPLTEAWQHFIMDLNSGLTKDGFRKLLSDNRAFTNYSGLGGPEPRADYINGLDLDAQCPAADKCRMCSMILHGVLSGSILTLETLDGSKPPPPIDWVLARPWLYFEAITVLADGSNGRFPQNGGRPVYWPLIAVGPVTVEIDKKFPGKPIPYVRRV